MQRLSPTLTLVFGWLVHLFTASGAFLGLCGFIAVANKQFEWALTLTALTIAVDAIDGPLARGLHVKKNIPSFDGALLDNIVDFITWVLLPCFFLIQSNMVKKPFSLIAAAAILLSASYQFCCTDVKLFSSTFKRWPSAWSVVIILLFVWQLSPLANMLTIFFFVIMSVIPLYYIHPFQENHVFNKTSNQRILIFLIKIGAIAFLISMLWAIKAYPHEIKWLTFTQQSALIFYFLMSIYQSFLLFKIKKF